MESRELIPDSIIKFIPIRHFPMIIRQEKKQDNYAGK